VSLYAKDQLMPNAAGWPQYRPAEGDPRSGVLTFKLQRDRGSDESKRAWQTILASPTDFFTTTVKVGVGLNDGQRFEFGGPETGQLIELVVLNKKLVSYP
jgi:hypothetical protein